VKRTSPGLASNMIDITARCVRIVNVDGQFHYSRIPSPHMANEAPE